MAFTAEQLDRYSRHILLKEFGLKGQKTLLNSKVLVVGAGGLGSPALMYLAAAGVGTIGIADADGVDLTNLQRQILHTTDDIGKPKVQSAAETIHALNPDVSVITHETYVTADNIAEIIRPYDFIIDGTDNFPAKYLINDACVLEGKPYSHAGILRFGGQLLTYVPGEGPCLRCVFPVPPPPELTPSCREAGVIGAMPGVVGSLQALEAIKYLSGVGDLLVGKLMLVDTLSMEFHTVVFRKEEDCPICGSHPSITTLIEYERAVCNLEEHFREELTEGDDDE